MMNQPKPCQEIPAMTLKNDGTGFDFESIIGGDGRILVLGEFDDSGP